MKKYVSGILKTICALIILSNVYIMSIALIKTDESEYSKLNSVSYVDDAIIYEEEITPEQKNVDSPVLETFIGSMTGYGPDCYGCSGITSSGYDLRNGNIYYSDNTFGQIRIVAADPKFRFGTVLKVSGLSIYSEPFLVIVLDRGGAIKGEKMDLAFDTEANPLVAQIGYSKNIQYEILRYGW